MTRYIGNNSEMYAEAHLHIYNAFFTFISRQRYVLGDSAMKRMAQSDVFISGMNGLGIEIGEFYVVS